MDTTIIIISLVLLAAFVTTFIWTLGHAAQRSRWLWVVVMVIAPASMVVYLLCCREDNDDQTANE